MPQDRPPELEKTAFSCPHCGAYTTQFWYKVFITGYEKNNTPRLPDAEVLDQIKKDTNTPDELRRDLVRYIERMMTEAPFVEKSEESSYNPPIVNNCNISRCYNCDSLAIWVHDKIVYPAKRIAIEPNSDLPEQIQNLFNEARAIVADSPKGAAALLRLCIQHLCIHLGEKGKNLDTDIGNLVSKGLNPLVQQSLDVVRVIGNESVHPGEIDLNDRRDTALKLFELVNLIADQMISHPKNVEQLYSELPENKRLAIDQRDNKSESEPEI